MARVAVELLDAAELDDPAEVHDPDPVADVLDDREVVGDEQVGQVEVARAGRAAGSGSGSGSTRRARRPARRRRRTPGPARAPGRCRCAGAGRPRTRAGSAGRSRAAGRPPRGSPRPACRGALPQPFSLSLGQQALADDVADRHPRVERADRVLEDDLHLAPQPPELFPYFAKVLAVERRPTRTWAGSSRRSVRPSVDLPQPDSPTRPKISPGVTSKSTSSTAYTSPTWRRMMPP